MPTDFGRRRLPHSYPENAWLFVTCHLNGSLPKNRYPPPGAPNAGKAFVWMDRYLDTARSGPRYLARDEIASVVANQLEEAQRKAHCDLGAYAVLPNHIHLLFRPKIDPSRLLKSLKGATARRANLILHLTGGSLWQAESYDRWVRTSDEWRRIACYIENNPVQAGLVARAEDYRWSSAWRGTTD